MEQARRPPPPRLLCTIAISNRCNTKPQAVSQGARSFGMRSILESM
jgi:hypothetical protein